MQIYPMLYFKKIADTGNLTKAAGELHMTPSALSGSLKRLEGSLGVNLFDRTGRKMVLNEYGKTYLQYAERILALNGQANEAISELLSDAESSLMIADVTISFASKLISRFLTEHPEISLTRTYFNPSEGPAEQDLHRYDFIIGSSNAVCLPDYTRRIIRSGSEVAAIMNRLHPMSSAGSLSLDDIAGEPLIVYLKGMPGRKMVDRIFREAGLKYHAAYESNSPYSMAPALERNLGIFLQPKHTAEDNMHIYPDCILIPVKNIRYDADTSVFFRTDRPLSRAAQKFLSFILPNDAGIG